LALRRTRDSAGDDPHFKDVTLRRILHASRLNFPTFSRQWVEALDEGDSKKEVEHRDAVYTMDIHEEGAGGDGKLLLKTKWRCRGLWWGDGDVALVLESEYKTRLSR
jgi:hypothetical protein